MRKLLAEIKQCTTCKDHLSHGCNPVIVAHKESKIAIIGQAPGRLVHESGTAWTDKSGERLRAWLGVTETQFYDPKIFAIVPMGFCYPGTGKTGDLPPRKECAPLWHAQLFEQMENLELILLIGRYAQKHYLGKQRKKNLTETVLQYDSYLPKYFPLPHPSPRNNIWQKKNPWFAQDVLPTLKKQLNLILPKE
ncbi:MAG: uracil-DNA glycosylase family protein [Aureispira sp.]|nr:uracil-DNA glycosylase family protein [Aureispira sp.]